MQSNADTTLELDRAEPSRAEPVGGEKWEEEEEEEEEMKEKRADAKIPGEWGWWRRSRRLIKTPLVAMRDGLQRYALINPRIRRLLQALGGISAQMKGWKGGVGVDRLPDLPGDTRGHVASSVGAIIQGRVRTKGAETGA